MFQLTYTCNSKRIYDDRQSPFIPLKGDYIHHSSVEYKVSMIIHNLYTGWTEVVLTKVS